MKKCLSFPIIFLLVQFNFAFALASEVEFASTPNPVGLASPEVEFASTPNPVGSGARAMGMGGAFIGVADDATAASWNPGGLVQLKKPELSLVVNGFHRTEDNTLGHYPEAGGSKDVSGKDINYLSVVYPFNFLHRNMVVSLNYQHLYNFTREGRFPNKYSDESTDGGITSIITVDEMIDYQLSGDLSALGIAYCIQIVPQFSFGFTLNFWEDDLFNNKWETTYQSSGSQTVEVPLHPPLGSQTVEAPLHLPFIYSGKEDRREQYVFSGFNANIGVLWRTSDKLTIGMVFKSPFTADIKHETVRDDYPKTVADEKLDMPMSYGIGIAYRFSDQFTLSADIYRTEWQDFILKDSEGNETSPVTKKSPDESDIDPTHQIRVGAEYLYIHPPSNYVIPLRAGVFYDPAPAEGSPDDFYGFSLGSGITLGRYVFDIACQYRFGNDIGASMIQNYNSHFSQDVDEYMIYSSLIIHF